MNVVATNDLPSQYRVLIQIWCVLVIIFGGLGNITVLVVFLLRWKLLSSYEVFIIILAVGDLMEILVLRSIMLHELAGGSFRGIGSNGCKIVYFLSSMSNYVSSLTLTMVAIDRYIAVKWPFKERKYIARSMMVAIWLIACCVATIYLSGDRVILNEADGICRMCAEDEVLVVALVTVCIQNAIPLIVMTIFSSLIVYELYKNSQAARERVSSGEMRERHRRIHRTSKILFVAIGLFFICVTPNNVFYLMHIFGVKAIPDQVHLVLTMLAMTNSCVNPCVYGKLHTTFRNETSKLFTHAWKKLFSSCSVKYQQDSNGQHKLLGKQNKNHSNTEMDFVDFKSRDSTTKSRDSSRKDGSRSGGRQTHLFTSCIYFKHNNNKVDEYFFINPDVYSNLALLRETDI